jgi:hypothetical protein
MSANIIAKTGRNTTIHWRIRWDMAVRPPPVPGTGHSTVDPIEECPVEPVGASISRPA